MNIIHKIPKNDEKGETEKAYVSSRRPFKTYDGHRGARNVSQAHIACTIVNAICDHT